MAKLVIRDTHPNLDGEYELDLARGFTKAEYHVMKKHVGIVAEDMMPGMPIDMNVMTAWGLVALRRAGKEHLFPAYMDTTDEQTTWDFPENEVVEDDALPPASAQTSVTENGSGDSADAFEKNGSSGPNTSDDSAVSPENLLSPTGTQP